MMNIKKIMSTCEQYPGVTYDFPFGSEPRCYRVGGKIFAQVFPTGVPGALTILREDSSISRETIKPMATFQCEAYFGDYYREKYKGFVFRPYHCPAAQQPHGNTVLLDPAIPDAVWLELIEHAYYAVFDKLTKKKQTEILAQSQPVE